MLSMQISLQAIIWNRNAAIKTYTDIQCVWLWIYCCRPFLFPSLSLVPLVLRPTMSERNESPPILVAHFFFVRVCSFSPTSFGDNYFVEMPMEPETKMESSSCINICALWKVIISSLCFVTECTPWVLLPLHHFYFLFFFANFGKLENGFSTQNSKVKYWQKFSVRASFFQIFRQKYLSLQSRNLYVRATVGVVAIALIKFSD